MNNARRDRVLDMLCVAICAAAAVWMLPDNYRVMAAIGGGLFGGGVRWLFSTTAYAHDRKIARKSVRAKKQPVDVFSALPVPVLLIDQAGTVTRANREAEQLLARDLKGVPISLVFRSPVILSAIDEAISRGVENALQFRARRPREMMLAASIRVLPDTAPDRIVLMIEDITSRILIEETRSDFVANASHELRTPLAAISGLVETLQGAAKDDPAAGERFLGMIAKQTVRMTRLVNDLLSLSRIEADENILPTTEEDVGAIVSEVLASMQPLAEARGAQIVADLSGDRLMVRGSRDELNQVFVNLIENAIKYARDSGPIRIAVSKRGESAAITVSDKGPGIDPEHVPRLTERFFRVDPADSRARGGTGLGLAIVKHIVNRHRGTLEISSIPGNGSDFIVCLPLAMSPRNDSS